MTTDKTADPATAITAQQTGGIENGGAEVLGGTGSRAEPLFASFGKAYYFPGVGKAIEGGLWSKDNPDGHVVLAIAENRQTIDVVQERLSRVAPVPREAFFYDSFQGVQRFRAALANMLSSTFMKGLDIDPEHICVQTGCGAILSNTFNLLGEAGDAVLIPAPYYPGFDFDTQANAGLVPVPVYLPAEGSPIPALSKAAEAAERDGHRVRAVLLTNPNNPLGTIYPEVQLNSLLSWSIERGVHLISDEVYANSVFGEGAEFVSLAALAKIYVAQNPAAAERVAAFLHVVFGVSKDFCASGFRVGAVYTQNASLIKGLAAAGYFAGVSNVVQHALADVFEDTAWLQGFVAENSRRLGAAYNALTGALKEKGIPFVPAVGAMSVWIDLRKGLTENSWAAERALWHRFADEQKVVLTPGECCHAEEPGWFRACYAWGDDIEGLTTVAQRISSVLQS